MAKIFYGNTFQKSKGSMVLPLMFTQYIQVYTNSGYGPYFLSFSKENGIIATKRY